MSPAPNRMHQKVSAALFNQTDKTLMIFKLSAVGEYGRPKMFGSRDRVAV
ncbi:MAG: hypothetical protein PVSMB11_13440 [Desulfuromonadaceae bacterium]